MNTTTNANRQDDIIDIKISGIARKRIRVNGDDNKIIEINPNDTKILERFTIGYEEYQKWIEEYTKAIKSEEEVEDVESLEHWKQIAKVLKTIDDKLRELLDYIFNANISAVCGDVGMCDPMENGKRRFDTIVDELFEFYNDNITRNIKKIQETSKKYTDKYKKKS